MVGYDGNGTSSLAVSLRDRAMCVLNLKSVNSKATQTNQKRKKKKTKKNAKGNPFFELTGSERQRFNRR